MTTTAAPPMRATDLLERLRRHVLKPGPLPGAAFVHEVMLTGTNSRADALSIGFTSASGRLLTGYEIKVSRADWRHELDQPGKADPWADQCHAWYVVAPSTDIVPPAELPDGWGLLVPNARSKTRLDTAHRARVHRDRQPSWDAVRSFVQRQDTLRAADETQVRADLDRTVRADVERQVRAQVDARVEQRLGQASVADEQLRLVADALGVRRISAHEWEQREDLITLDELRAAADLWRAHRDVRRAVQHLTGRYAPTVDRLRQHLHDLAQTLAVVAELHAPSPDKDTA